MVCYLYVGAAEAQNSAEVASSAPVVNGRVKSEESPPENPTGSSSSSSLSSLIGLAAKISRAEIDVPGEESIQYLVPVSMHEIVY